MDVVLVHDFAYNLCENICVKIHIAEYLTHFVFIIKLLGDISKSNSASIFPDRRLCY